MLVCCNTVITMLRLAQEAKRAEYNCVCGRPLRVQAMPGKGWYKAHCEHSSAHKAYICTGQNWVDNRGQNKSTTPTKAASTKATSIKVFCSPRKTSANNDCGLHVPSDTMPQPSLENALGIYVVWAREG